MLLLCDSFASKPLVAFAAYCAAASDMASVELHCKLLFAKLQQALPLTHHGVHSFRKGDVTSIIVEHTMGKRQKDRAIAALAKLTDIVSIDKVMTLYCVIHGVDPRVAHTYQSCVSSLHRTMIVDSDHEEQLPHQLVAVPHVDPDALQIAAHRRGRPSAKMKRNMYDHVHTKADAVRMLGIRDNELDAARADARSARRELMQLKRRVRASKSAPPPSRGSLSIVQSSSDLNKPFELVGHRKLMFCQRIQQVKRCAKSNGKGEGEVGSSVYT